MSHKSSKIEGEDAEFIKIELENVKFDYTIIESDRKAFQQEAKLVIHKQEKELARLKEENRVLLLLNNISNDPLFKKEDRELREEFKLLLNSKQEIHSIYKIEKEKKEHFKRIIQELKCEVDILEKAYVKCLGVDRNKKNIYQALDNSFISLKNITANYDRKIKENSTLREEINNLKAIKEKNTVTLNEYKSNLKNAKIELKYFSDENAAAYQQRREDYDKIAHLKDRNDKDERKFISELRDYFRQIDHLEKLGGFMLQKTDSRVEIKNEVQSMIEKYTPKHKEQAYNLKEYMHLLTSYDENYSDLKDLNEEKCKMLLNELKDKDNENYSLFSYLYKLQADVDELKIEIKKYEKNINEIEEKVNERMNKRQDQFDRIEAKYIRVSNTINAHKTIVETEDKLLEFIYKKLQIVMKQLDFTDDNEYKKNFNDVSFPSAENIIYFLKLIEKKISQQIITFYYTKFKEDPHFNLRGSHNILFHRKKLHDTLVLGLNEIELEEAIDVIPKSSTPFISSSFNKLNENKLIPIDYKNAFNSLRYITQPVNQTRIV